MNYWLLCGGTHPWTVSKPCKIRPLSARKIVDGWSLNIFESSQTHPKRHLSQLRGRHGVTQLALRWELESPHLGSLFVGSRDGWLWSLFHVLATIWAESFWWTIQAAGGPGVARGYLVPKSLCTCNQENSTMGGFPKACMAYSETSAWPRGLHHHRHCQKAGEPPNPVLAPVIHSSCINILHIFWGKKIIFIMFKINRF